MVRPIQKTALTKAPAKAKATAKPAQRTASRVGAQYACQTCGLLVVIDQDCGCGTIDLVCCGGPMKKKRAACAK